VTLLGNESTNNRKSSFQISILDSSIQVNTFSILVVSIVIIGFFTVSSTRLAQLNTWSAVFYMMFSVSILVNAMVGLLISLFSKGRIISSSNALEISSADVAERERLLVMSIGFTLQVFIATVFLILSTIVYVQYIALNNTTKSITTDSHLPFWISLGCGILSIVYVIITIAVNKNARRFLLSLTGDSSYRFRDLRWIKDGPSFFIMLVFPILLYIFINSTLGISLSESLIKAIPFLAWQTIEIIALIICMLVLFFLLSLALKKMVE